MQRKRKHLSASGPVQDITRLEKSERLKYGKKREQEILDAMAQEYNWLVFPSSAQQDKFDKIDAFVKTPYNDPYFPSEEFSLQVKYRKTGDDILVETMLFWHPESFEEELIDWDNYGGRDLVGKSEKTAILNRQGDKIYVIDTLVIKELAKSMVEKVADILWDTLGEEGIYNLYEGWIENHPGTVSTLYKITLPEGTVNFQSDTYQRSKYDVPENIIKVVSYIQLSSLKSHPSLSIYPIHQSL